jgi:aminopeptidase N
LVNINADGVLLAELPDTKTPEQNLMQFLGSKEFLSKFNALNGIKDQVGKNPANKIIGSSYQRSFLQNKNESFEINGFIESEQFKAMGSDVEKLA